MNLNGTAAIVSGGASGLGEATARDLAAAGCRVLVADLNDVRGSELAKELSGEFARTDVADEQSVAEAVPAAQRLGPPPPGLVPPPCIPSPSPPPRRHHPPPP